MFIASLTQCRYYASVPLSYTGFFVQICCKFKQNFDPESPLEMSLRVIFEIIHVLFRNMDNPPELCTDDECNMIWRARGP